MRYVPWWGVGCREGSWEDPGDREEPYGNREGPGDRGEPYGFREGPVGREGLGDQEGPGDRSYCYLENPKEKKKDRKTFIILYF